MGKRKEKREKHRLTLVLPVSEERLMHLPVSLLLCLQSYCFPCCRKFDEGIIRRVFCVRRRLEMERYSMCTYSKCCRLWSPGRRSHSLGRAKGLFSRPSLKEEQLLPSEWHQYDFYLYWFYCFLQSCSNYIAGFSFPSYSLKFQLVQLFDCWHPFCQEGIWLAGAAVKYKNQSINQTNTEHFKCALISVCIFCTLPVREPLAGVYADEPFQVLYVTDLSGFQRMDLELGHRSLQETFVAPLLQLLPQGDDVCYAGPKKRAGSILFMYIICLI